MRHTHIKRCVHILQLRLWTLDVRQKGKFTDSLQGEVHQTISSDLNNLSFL